MRNKSNSKIYNPLRYQWESNPHALHRQWRALTIMLWYHLLPELGSNQHRGIQIPVPCQLGDPAIVVARYRCPGRGFFLSSFSLPFSFVFCTGDRTRTCTFSVPNRVNYQLFNSHKQEQTKPIAVL